MSAGLRRPPEGCSRTSRSSRAAAVAEELGVKLENVTLKDMGRAKRITIDKDNTTLIDGAGKRPTSRADRQIRNQIEETTSDYDREAAGAVGEARRRRGGDQGRRATGRDEGERGSRTRCATRAAVEEGVVPGGGVALIRCQPALDSIRVSAEERFGVNIVRRAIGEPLRHIAERGRRGGSSSSTRSAAAGRVRLQRVHRGIRGPAEVRHHRPDEGRAPGAAERGVGGGPHANDQRWSPKPKKTQGCPAVPGGMGGMPGVM